MSARRFMIYDGHPFHCLWLVVFFLGGSANGQFNLLGIYNCQSYRCFPLTLGTSVIQKNGNCYFWCESNFAVVVFYFWYKFTFDKSLVSIGIIRVRASSKSCELTDDNQSFIYYCQPNNKMHIISLIMANFR